MTSCAPGNPLRVLHLNSMLTGGGTDDQCVKLTRGLLDLGVGVQLAGPDGREFSRIARELGIPFQPTPPEGPLKLRFIGAAARMIWRERIQVVHGHHGRDLWPTVLAAWLSGRRPRIVLSRHLAKSPGSAFSRRFLLNRTDAVVAVSHFVARVLREGADEPNSPEPERRHRPPIHGDLSRIHVAYGGIDTARFRPGDAAAQRAEWGVSPEEKVFAVVGAYDLPRGKGHREFLEAAAQIHHRIPKARFLVIGRGTLRETLLSDIVRLKLEGKAWLTPWCRDMPAAMNALDCLVHPQVGTEALALVVLEAFACGKPVIASALDGIPEAWETTGFGRLLPTGDVPALADAMLEWAQAPPLSESQKKEMHARVDHDFSLVAAARRVKNLYEQLMNARSTANPIS